MMTVCQFTLVDEPLCLDVEDTDERVTDHHQVDEGEDPRQLHEGLERCRDPHAPVRHNIRGHGHVRDDSRPPAPVLRLEHRDVDVGKIWNGQSIDPCRRHVARECRRGVEYQRRLDADERRVGHPVSYVDAAEDPTEPGGPQDAGWETSRHGIRVGERPGLVERFASSCAASVASG